jgi:hypothetical protein
MIERDPQRIHDDEGKVPELAFNVSNQRVQHYADVVEYLVNNEIARCQAAGFSPTKKQVDFLRKEIVRYAVIRRDVETAQSLKIKQSSILNEADHRISTRAKLQ